MTTLDELKNIFTYHTPVGDQAERYERLRAAALAFASTVFFNTPAGPDQMTAIRKIREAVMTANAAIALERGPEA